MSWPGSVVVESVTEGLYPAVDDCQLNTDDNDDDKEMKITK